MAFFWPVYALVMAWPQTQWLFNGFVIAGLWFSLSALVLVDLVNGLTPAFCLTFLWLAHIRPGQ
jgi:hypothetical protein